MSICKHSHKPITKVSFELSAEEKTQLIDEETHLPNRYALFASHFDNVDICLADIRNYSLIAQAYRTEISEAILMDFFSIVLKFSEMYSCRAYRYDVDMVAIVLDSCSDKANLFDELVEHLKKRLAFYIFDTTPYSLHKDHIAISVAFGTSKHKKVRAGIFAAERSLDINKKNSYISGARHSSVMPDYKHLSNQAVLFMKSIDENHLLTIIQPIMDCETGFIVRYEALIRIQQEENTFNPGSFLDGVYAFGLSDVLFLWVFKEVIEKCDGREISVNILPTNIMSDHVRETIFQTFSAHPSKAICLTFELLETENDGDATVISDFINMVREFGAKIAIDDFGTGYSNFNRVFWEGNVDFIKIDGSFVQRSKYDHRARTMITVIAKMARENGILTIAEYVSDREIFEIVHACGVDYIQGYYISKGFPLEKRCANDPMFRATKPLPFERSSLHQE